MNDAAFDLPSYIAKEFARRVGAKEEEAFFVGDGKGKPTGIFADAGGAEDGVTTSGAAITFDDIMETAISLHICWSMVMPNVAAVVYLANRILLLLNRMAKNYWRTLSERHYHDL